MPPPIRHSCFEPVLLASFSTFGGPTDSTFIRAKLKAAETICFPPLLFANRELPLTA
jgi:hypothetical protein